MVTRTAGSKAVKNTAVLKDVKMVDWKESWKDV